MQSRNPIDKGTVWGILLVVVGALFLVQTLGIVSFAWNVIISLAFLVGAVAFLSVFVQDRRQWWALFPAIGLGFVGFAIGFGEILPSFHWGGSLLLGGLGLAFAVVYSSNRQNWWAIIPSGVLLTLGLIALIDAVIPRFDTGWLFFTGMTLTFGFLYWEERQQRWALYPAIACGALALLLVVGSLLRFIFPIALVAVGVYLLVRRQSTPNGPQ